MKKIVRLLIVLALSVAATLANAQAPKKILRVALFHVGLDHVPPSLEPLRQELKKLGYEEGKNISLDWRNLPDEDAAHKTAKEFVRNKVDLIVAFENQTVRGAQAATSDIPVVFLHVSDPVAEGFVKSLAHPGGNMTGFSGLWWDVPGKKLELFKEMIPRLRQLLVLVDPQDPASGRLLAESRSAAKALKLDLAERNVASQADIERVFKAIKPGEMDGVFLVSPKLYVNFTSLIIRLSLEKRLPMQSHRKEWVEQGAVFSYGTDLAAIGPFAARYIDKVFKDAKPADLPVEQPTKFELIINLKTAKQIGLTIPPNVLARADKVIK